MFSVAIAFTFASVIPLSGLIIIITCVQTLSKRHIFLREIDELDPPYSPFHSLRACMSISSRTRLYNFRHFASPRILPAYRRSFFSTTPTSNTIMSSSSSEQQPQQPQGQGWIWNKLGYEDLPADVASKGFYDLEADLPGSDGKSLKMADHKGKVVLIVNTASQW